MDRLLILSVYSTGSLRWLNLQTEQIRSTTSNYQHAIYCHNINSNQQGIINQIPNTIIVGSSDNTNPTLQHIDGLTKLTNYALKTPHRSCLVLDSDCFPITPYWETNLLDAMDKRQYACMVRPENLDTFAHPSLCFFKNLIQPCFKTKRVVNLLGEQWHDVVCDVIDYFPLLRTNKTNLHPVGLGIYYNMFYHHSCGSRKFEMRSFYKYYKNNYDFEKLTALTNDFPTLLRKLV